MRRLGPAPGARIAVVGAAGGIGQALTAALIEDGARVAALDMPRSLAAGLPDGLALSAEVDAGDPASVAGAFAAVGEALGGLEGMVNLAGFNIALEPMADIDPASVAGAFAAVGEALGGLEGMVNLAGFNIALEPMADIDPAGWEEVLRVNLTGAFLCARAAIPLLRQGRDPVLLTAASGLGAKPSKGYGAYGASKAGVISMTRNLAVENAPWLRVNAVAPSAVDTAFLRGGTGRSQTNTLPMDLDEYERAVPLGRIAVPEDVVGPTLFLLGPAAGYMTGQILHVNGGLFMP